MFPITLTKSMVVFSKCILFRKGWSIKKCFSIDRQWSLIFKSRAYSWKCFLSWSLIHFNNAIRLRAEHFWTDSRQKRDVSKLLSITLRRSSCSPCFCANVGSLPTRRDLLLRHKKGRGCARNWFSCWLCALFIAEGLNLHLAHAAAAASAERRLFIATFN
jgi:hypothetical protein